MEYKVDYHFHSWYSDGVKKPTELVKWYKHNDYDEIALTDHEGVDGVREAQIAGEALGIQVITGIELATEYAVHWDEEPLEIHLLGYRFDLENSQLNEKLIEIKENRRNRNDRLLKALEHLGYPLSCDDLIKRPGQTYIGKPDFARALVDKGYIKRPKDAYCGGDFLSHPEILRIKKKKISTEEAISLLKGAGGIAVMAHPMEIYQKSKVLAQVDKGKADFYQKLYLLVKELKAKGLGGIECFHPSANKDDEVELVNMAAKLHLHITRGSDYHGINL